MANECLNQLRIEAPIERLEFLLRGASPLDDAPSTEAPGAPPIPELLAGLGSAGGCRNAHFSLGRGWLTCSFESRWDPPADAIEAFAARHPDLVVELRHAEPGFGFFGLLRYASGTLADQASYDEDDAIAEFVAAGWDFECEYRLNTALELGRLVTALGADWCGPRSAGQ